MYRLREDLSQQKSNNHSMETSAVRVILAFVFVCGAALLAGASPAWPAPTKVTVGDPANPAALSQAVQDAYDAGTRTIVIKRGVYLLPKIGRSQLDLYNWKDATISAYGVTLINDDNTWNHNLFNLSNCTNVTIEGPILSQSVVPFFQGRVTAIGNDPNGKAYADWKPDVGYPQPDPYSTSFPSGSKGSGANVVDAHTRLLKVGNGDLGGSLTANADGTFRVHFNSNKLNFGVGDFLVGRGADAAFKLYLGNCRNCTVRDVIMMRNGFAPLREDDGGGNRYLHITWALGPRPAGATEDPVVTNAADGMHMVGSDPGPDVENCDFQGVFLDDCIAIHGGFETISAVNGNAVTIGRSAQFKVGEPARISDQHGFYADAMVTAVAGDIVTLDKDYNVPIGAKMSNPKHDGEGYKIINCHLGSTRSRGTLLKSDNGLVENNIFENCGMSAVSLGPEYYWGEADYVHNVTVKNNTFRNIGGAGYGGSAVYVHGDGAQGNANIVIEGNKFFSDYQGDILIDWTKGATVANNTITGAPVWPSSTNTTSAILVSHSDGVTFTGNVIHNAGVYKSDTVHIGDDVANMQGNDTRGVKIESGR